MNLVDTPYERRAGIYKNGIHILKWLPSTPFGFLRKRSLQSAKSSVLFFTSLTGKQDFNVDREE